jgi:transposase-like protein
MEELKLFKCLDCDYKGINNKNLKLHISNKHTIKERKYICEKCNYKFITEKKLYEHIKLNHGVNGEIRFKCDLCDNDYSSKDGLNRHKKNIDHEKRKINFRCINRQCGFNCKYKNELDEHIKENKHDTKRYIIKKETTNILKNGIN